MQQEIFYISYKIYEIVLWIYIKIMIFQIIVFNSVNIVLFRFNRDDLQSVRKAVVGINLLGVKG